jgi:hypothetical protein
MNSSGHSRTFLGLWYKGAERSLASNGGMTESRGSLELH